jgi:hypothetical protein
LTVKSRAGSADSPVERRTIWAKAASDATSSTTGIGPLDASAGVTRVQKIAAVVDGSPEATPCRKATAPAPAWAVVATAEAAPAAPMDFRRPRRSIFMTLYSQ